MHRNGTWRKLGLVLNPHMPDCAGEWGGHCNPGTPDYAWHEQLAKFLVDRGMTDNFYWCLNPTSTDTARPYGYMDDGCAQARAGQQGTSPLNNV